MSSSQHSEPLLSEEKFEDIYTDEEKLELQDTRTQLSTHSKWSRKGMAMIVSLLLVAALFLVAGTSAWVASTKPEAPKVTEASSPEQFLTQAARAAGDTYLIGVGKADITGYVTCDLTSMNFTNLTKTSCRT